MIFIFLFPYYLVTCHVPSAVDNFKLCVLLLVLVMLLEGAGLRDLKVSVFDLLQKMLWYLLTYGQIPLLSVILAQAHKIICIL